jgi:hypothetical protein
LSLSFMIYFYLGCQSKMLALKNPTFDETVSEEASQVDD